MYLDGGFTSEKYMALRADADAGEPDAMYELGILWLNVGYQQKADDYSQNGLAMLKGAVRQGCAEAATYLGTVYHEGKCGLTIDMCEAVSWYKIGAEMGDPLAMSNYGIALQRGDGNAPCDDEEAMRWICKAADAGLGVAQYNAALAYHAGKGVRIDRVKAKHYFTMAADNGMEMARLWLYSEDYKN